MQKNCYNKSCILEVTILSAEGLKKNSGVFTGRLRPFVTLTIAPPPPPQPPQPPFSIAEAFDGCSISNKVYVTRVDEGGGINPEWGDKFQLSLDDEFFYQRQSCIYLELYTKHLMMGRSQLGWFRIPATDIMQNVLPAGSVGHLSYRVRDRDGCRGDAVVNVAVKLLQGSVPFVHPHMPLISNLPHLPKMRPCHTAIGIPVIKDSSKSK